MSSHRALKWAVPTSLLLAFAIGTAACGSGGGKGSPTLTSIDVTPTSVRIASGITQQFVATGAYSDGSTKDVTAQATWASATPATATISMAGLATGVQSGSTTISATVGTVVGSTPLTVTAATLVRIALTPASTSIAAGTTQQFAATGHFSNGDAQDVTQQATWTSSTPATATIASTGLATGVAAGSTNISASLAGITGATPLAVTSHTLQSIQVIPASPQVPAGLKVSLTATGTFSDGSTQDLTSQASWTSSSLSVATVAVTGIVTGVSPGTSTISATLTGVVGSTPVTVDSSVLKSIAVTPVDQAIPVGTTLQMTATGTFSDGDSHDVTTLVSWTTNPTGLVSMSSTGLATGVAPGTARVIATLSGVSGGTNLTVGAAPAIPDPPPDLAAYFQIMIDNRIAATHTPYFTVTASQLYLNSPIAYNVTWLTGGGPSQLDWTAPVFQIVDSATGTSSGVDFATTYSFTLADLPLDVSGQYRILKIPFLDPNDPTKSLGGSARLTITLDQPSTISIDDSTGPAGYSFTMPTQDPTALYTGGQDQFDFVEFNCATPAVNGVSNCVINTSNVDFFFLGITVKGRQAGAPDSTIGLDVSVPNAYGTLLAALRALPADYVAGNTFSGAVPGPAGRFLRYLSPGHSFGPTSTDLDPEITASWDYYASNTLSFNINGTQYTATNVGGSLTFTSPENFSIAMPTTQEAITCTGPLDNAGQDANVQDAQKFIAAYLNRGVFQNVGVWYTPTSYYPPGGTWNQYAQLLHQSYLQNWAYGFSYDDVPTVPQTNPAINNATSTSLVLSYE